MNCNDDTIELPHVELLEKLKAHQDFTVVEKLDPMMYSLIVFYKNDTLCSRGTFRRANCYKYKDKRKAYIADLEQELIKLNITV